MNRDDFRESEIARGEQIDDVVTRGEKILFLPADIPMPQWSLHGALFRPQGDWIHEVGLFRRRNNHLPNTIFTFTRASLGRAIASHHHCQISDPELNDGEETCLNTVRLKSPPTRWHTQ